MTNKVRMFSTTRGQTTPNAITVRRTPASFAVACLILELQKAAQAAREAIK